MHSFGTSIVSVGSGCSTIAGESSSNSAYEGKVSSEYSDVAVHSDDGDDDGDEVDSDVLHNSTSVEINSDPS